MIAEEYYTLNLPDLSIHIDLVPALYQYSFSHEINSGLVKKHSVLGFSNNYPARQITVMWVENHITTEGKIIKSEQMNYIDKDFGTYKTYHDALTGEASGVAYAKQCIQGIIFRKWGHRPFDLEGNFVQYPVTEP